MPDLDVPPEVQAVIASQFAGLIGGELHAIDASIADHNSKKSLRGLNIDKEAIIRSTGLQMPGSSLPAGYQPPVRSQQTLTDEQLVELEQQAIATAGLSAANAAIYPQRQAPVSSVGFPIQNSQILQLLSTNDALTSTLHAMNVLLLDIQAQVRHIRKQLTTVKPK